MAAKSMISHVEIFEANLALKQPFKIAIMTMEHAQNVFVRIHTESGTYGTGEASPFWKIVGETQATDLAAAADLAKFLVGKDALAIGARMAAMEGFLQFNTTILSAFDMALYDLASKLCSLPLYRFLGGESRPMRTDWTIGLSDPDHMARQARDIVAQGFEAVKLKLGEGWPVDFERVSKVRDAIGTDIPIRIDANQGWDFPQALRLLEAMAPLGIQYCEQPLTAHLFEDMVRLRQKTRIPIMADESLFSPADGFRLAAMGACDYFNIKLSKSGGIRNALDIAAIARSRRLGCMLGCMMESRLGLSAAAHLAAAHPIIQFLDLDSGLLLAQDPVLGGMTYEGPRVILPETPGHGADIAPDFLESTKKTSIQ